MSIKSLIYYCLAITTVIFFDILAYPYFSFSVILFSIIYLFLKKSDYLLSFFIIQIIVDFIFIKIFALTFLIWVLGLFLADYLSEKYFYNDNKILKLFFVLFSFCGLKTTIDFLSVYSNTADLLYFIIILFRSNVVYLLLSFLGLMLVSVVSSIIKSRNFLRVT